MSTQEAKLHHFVPKLLLRPWLLQNGSGQFNLVGYFWDNRHSRLHIKKRGLDSFCAQLGLLSLKTHKFGRDAIERIFFGDIDTKGAIARDLLVSDGPDRLNADRRSDFARLLLSLEARRPATVAQLREHKTTFAKVLDADPRILAAAKEAGIKTPPSIFFEERIGSLEDRALMAIQKLVDNPDIGERLINSNWHITKFKPRDETLILSDRPLIRLRGYNEPGAAWILPLDPHICFFAVNHPNNLDRIKSTPAHRLIRYVNAASVRQAERFVFCVDARHEKWIGKHLSRQRRAEPVWLDNSKEILSLPLTHPPSAPQ